MAAPLLGPVFFCSLRCNAPGGTVAWGQVEIFLDLGMHALRLSKSRYGSKFEERLNRLANI